jgi:hypothetical protein
MDLTEMPTSVFLLQMEMTNFPLFSANGKQKTEGSFPWAANDNGNRR